MSHPNRNWKGNDIDPPVLHWNQESSILVLFSFLIFPNPTRYLEGAAVKVLRITNCVGMEVGVSCWSCWLSWSVMSWQSIRWSLSKESAIELESHGGMVIWHGVFPKSEKLSWSSELELSWKLESLQWVGTWIGVCSWSCNRIWSIMLESITIESEYHVGVVIWNVVSAKSEQFSWSSGLELSWKLESHVGVVDWDGVCCWSWNIMMELPFEMESHRSWQLCWSRSMDFSATWDGSLH